MASSMAGWLCAALRSLRSFPFLKSCCTAIWPIKSFTSERWVSSATERAHAASTTAAASRICATGGRRTRSGSDELAVGIERHQNSKARQKRDHGGASVADQRQRHADHRQDAAHHAGIDEHVDEEAERDGAPGQPGERVLALHGEVQSPADHHAVQGQDQQLTEKTEFLADHREDEVGGALGEELELRLAAVHVSLAEHAPGTDGDLRLNDVITRSQPIGFGIEEGENALALIVVDDVPGSPCRAAEQRY